MAKKVYEEEKIQAIAEKIREHTGQTTSYTTEEMPSGVDEANEAGYNEGYGRGEYNAIYLSTPFFAQDDIENTITTTTDNTGYAKAFKPEIYERVYDIEGKMFDCSLTDFVDWGTLGSSSELLVSAENIHNFATVQLIIRASCETDDPQASSAFDSTKVLEIAPMDDNSIAFVCPQQGTTFDWTVSLLGVLFKL